MQVWEAHSHHLALAYAGPCLHAIPDFPPPSGLVAAGQDLKTGL